MSTSESYPGIIPDEYDDRREAAAGGSGGAILGVLMTLLIGCGLVFAAYKLGQRTSVDDPPLINANLGEAKMAPIDEGGTPIVNQDNDAYTMIDEIRRAGTSSVEQDGVVVSDRLPERALDPAGTLSVTAAQEDALRIDELQLASSVEGQPSLTDNSAPDRTGDLELAGGAEVQVADSEAVLRAETAASEATRSAEAQASAAARAAAERDVAALVAPSGVVPSSSAPAIAPLTRAPDTTVAIAPAAPTSNSLTEGDFGRGIVLYPVPRSKPDLAQRPPRPATLRRPNPQPSAAVATTRVPGVVPLPGNALPGQVRAPALQAQPVRVPAQPIGDAQVQLGAMPTGDLVRARWQQLRAQHPDLLGQLGIQVQPVRTAQGQSLFRLRAGPLRDSQQAVQLCGQLRVRGVDCFVPAR